MADEPSGPAFERALSIVHEGLRGARESADEVREVARAMEIGFMDVVAAAIATEIVKAFRLDEVNIEA